MKIQEVRIGNWVLVPTDKKLMIPVYPKKVLGITKFGELDFTETSYSENHIVPVIHCAGIPLTEEIFLKAGLETTEDISNDLVNHNKNVKYYDLLQGTVILRMSELIQLCFYNDPDLFLIRKFEYVHELQNLYFELMYKELVMDNYY